MQFSTTWRIVLSLVRNVCTNTNTSTSTSTSGPPLVRAVVVEEEENAPTLSATLSACIMRGHPTPYQLRAKQKTCRFRKISFFTCMICLTLATHGITHSEKHRETLLIVCHPDESAYLASALGERTHVVVVTDANSSGKGTKRKAYLENAMKITGSSMGHGICQSQSTRVQKNVTVGILQSKIRSSSGWSAFSQSIQTSHKLYA